MNSTVDGQLWLTILANKIRSKWVKPEFDFNPPPAYPSMYGVPSQAGGQGEVNIGGKDDKYGASSDGLEGTSGSQSWAPCGFRICDHKSVTLINRY